MTVIGQVRTSIQTQTEVASSSFGTGSKACTGTSTKASTRKGMYQYQDKGQHQDAGARTRDHGLPRGVCCAPWLLVSFSFTSE